MSVGVPPVDENAERGLISCLMQDATVLDTIDPPVLRDDFHTEQARTAFDAIIHLREVRRVVHLDTIFDIVKHHDTFSKGYVGAGEYLADVQGMVPSPVMAPEYAKIVREQSTLREMIRAAQRIIIDCDNPPDDFNKFLADTQAHLKAATERQSFSTIRSMAEIAEEHLPYMEKIWNGEIDNVLYQTQFEDLNKILTGFAPGDLVIVGARPSMGKTAFGLNLMHGFCVDGGYAAGMFSLEMSAEQLHDRMVGSAALLNTNNFRQKKSQWGLNDEQIRKYAKWSGALQEAKIYIDDSPALSITDVTARARRMYTDHDISLLFVDYLQLMQGSGRYRDNRVNEVSEISAGLKQIARELKIPVIALTQLNRGTDNRPNKRPMLADIRESGSVEQDADMVLFLYRDDYYTDESQTPNQVEVIVAKNRNGATGMATLYFKKEFTRFANLWEADANEIRPKGTEQGTVSPNLGLIGEDVPE